MKISISIHALLAESDAALSGGTLSDVDFYPRSPCGERPIFAVRPYDAPIFLSTLSLRRATYPVCPGILARQYFYPRSPCGERRGPRWIECRHPLFLSTLSLRRATTCTRRPISRVLHFYPRSPCGERHCQPGNYTRCCVFLSTLSLRRATARHPTVRVNLNDISIHALLAESDTAFQKLMAALLQFLSTLSLRRATTSRLHKILADWDFYPRSPCGERRQRQVHG